MANEFVVKNGLIVSGSITSSGPIIASEFSGSFSGSFQGDGSQLTNLPSTFPYTGSAEITGSLEVDGVVFSTQGIANPSILTNAFTTTVGYNHALVGPMSFSSSVTVVTGSTLNII